MTALGNISAAGLGLVLAIIAFIQWRKSSGTKGVCWLALLAAMLLSGAILSYLGTLTAITIFGVGLMPLILLVSGFLFYHEVIKGRGMHYVRTPLVAVALGVSLMSVGGAITGLAQTGVNSVVNVVHTTGNIGSGIGGGG